MSDPKLVYDVFALIISKILVFSDTFIWRKYLEVEPVDEKPRTYKSNWLGHVAGMSKNVKNSAELMNKMDEEELEEL